MDMVEIFMKSPNVGHTAGVKEVWTFAPIQEGYSCFVLNWPMELSLSSTMSCDIVERGMNSMSQLTITRLAVSET